MKCNSCQTAIPPTFTKALQDNMCPACGKSIMGSSLYSEFNSIKEKLADADVDEATLVKVASLIAGKYDLLPRGSAGAAKSSMQMSRPKTKAQVADADIESELLDEYPHLRSLPEEERKREIMALRAEAEREYGLSKGDSANSKLMKERGGRSSESSELASAMSDLMPPTLPLYGDLDENSSDPQVMHRMAKMAAMKDNPNVHKFRRMDG
jgi:hypothetical protein